MTESDDPRTQFIRAAIWHGSLERAEVILKTHPELASSDIHTAAILGDDTAVRRFLEQDPASATRPSPPYGGDALNYLCLSKYLRLDPARSAGLLRAARALLDAGVDANTGFWTTGQHPERETALYGAAGVAHHAEMTALLLERGADPNDEEAVYHSPETDDTAAMKLLVETGKITPINLVMMLIRKHDWHDYEGAKWLLEHGADPNQARERGWSPIHHAIARDNVGKMIALLLDHKSDPTRTKEGITAITRAARRGRGDLLALFAERGFSIELDGVDGLIAASAMNDGAKAHAIAKAEPLLVRELIAQGGQRLTEFAGTWNTEGVRLLLDLGVPVDAPYSGDGYFGIEPGSTALHMAAWKGLTETVELLLARRAKVDATDAKGRTPLMLAVKATVDSYWTERRTPETVRALLKAGASSDKVLYPSGYAEVDELLEAARDS
jgi:ankyrin repeat protein